MNWSFLLNIQLFWHQILELKFSIHLFSISFFNRCLTISTLGQLVIFGFLVSTYDHFYMTCLHVYKQIDF